MFWATTPDAVPVGPHTLRHAFITAAYLARAAR